MGIVWVIVLSAIALRAALGIARAISCARLNRYFRAFAPSSLDVARVIDRRGDGRARLEAVRRASAARISIAPADSEAQTAA